MASSDHLPATSHAFTGQCVPFAFSHRRYLDTGASSSLGTPCGDDENRPAKIWPTANHAKGSQRAWKGTDLHPPLVFKLVVFREANASPQTQMSSFRRRFVFWTFKDDGTRILRPNKSPHRHFTVCHWLPGETLHPRLGILRHETRNATASSTGLTRLAVLFFVEKTHYQQSHEQNQPEHEIAPHERPRDRPRDTANTLPETSSRCLRGPPSEPAHTDQTTQGTCVPCPFARSATSAAPFFVAAPGLAEPSLFKRDTRVEPRSAGNRQTA